MHALISRRELDFLLHEWLDIEALLDRPAFSEHSRDTIEAVIDLSEKLAIDQFLPHHREADLHEPWLDEDGAHILQSTKTALQHYAQLGLFAAGFGTEHGGLGLPFLGYVASYSLFAAANISTAGYPLLTAANARVITAFGTPAQIETFARPQIEGRWFGTMCLSEPQAGSSLGDIRMRADPDGEDALGRRYRLTGNKMWISGGDQDASENIVHLVLGKVPGKDGRLPEGSKGISLFIVPKFNLDGSRNDVAVAGLNHKLGYHGITNCALNFGEQGGAIGWIVGQEGDGLRQMFQMMNEARILIGLGAAALGYRGYRHAADYARQRTQGRPAGTKQGEPVAIIEHADVRHMLLAQKVYAEGALALCFYAARLMDEEGADSDASTLLGLLTPVVKSWPSEYGLLANDLAIQVHGGYGYTRDFPVELLFRDNRLNPIHEGTAGIQAIDLLGRKILRDDGSALAALNRRMTETIAKAAGIEQLARFGRDLDERLVRSLDVADVLRSAAPARALDNATTFLRAFGHVVVAWLWLDMAVCASALDEADERRPAKLHCCRYFYEWELPKVDHMLALVSSMNDIASSAPHEIF